MTLSLLCRTLPGASGSTFCCLLITSLHFGYLSHLGAAENTTTSASGALRVVAAPAPSAEQTLDELRQDLARTPAAATVVDGAELRHFRALTLRDALQDVPGVYVQSRFGFEESRLSIRGSGIQRTFHLRGIELLQDGQPITLADGSGDFQTFDPLQTSHITVLRGAQAAGVGAATLGGAIAYASPNGSSDPGAQLQAQAGSFGLWRGAGSYGWRSNDGSDGYAAMSGYRSSGYRDHSTQRNVRFAGNYGSDLGSGFSNRVYAAYADSDSQLPGSLNRWDAYHDPQKADPGSVQRDAKRDYQQTRVADRLVWEGDADRLEAFAGYLDKDLYHPLSFGLIEQATGDLSGGLRWDSQRPLLGQDNRLTVGLRAAQGRTLARVSGYAAPLGNASGPTLSETLLEAITATAWVHEQLHLGGGVWAAAGVQGTWAQRSLTDRIVRWSPVDPDDSNARIWRGLNPSAGLLWAISDEDEVYSAVARGFEPPTFAEYVQTDLSGRSRPQQGLEAQRSWSVELGTRSRHERWGWDAAMYHAWLTNEFLAYQISPGLTQTTNADDTIHAGIELGARAVPAEDLLRTGDRITISQIYNLGLYRFDGDGIYGDGQLPGLPQQTWRGTLAWSWQGLDIGSSVDYQGPIPVDFTGTTWTDRSWLLSARVAWQSRPWNAFVEGRNLTDERWVATTGIAPPTSIFRPTTQPALLSLFNPGEGRAVYVGAGRSF
jgi:iron complex outermembrane receptor protein